MRNNPVSPLIGANALARVIVLFTSNGQSYEINLDYLSITPTTFTPTFLEFLGTSVQSVIQASLLAVLPPTASITGYLVQDLNPATCPSQLIPVTGAVGTAGASAANGMISAVLTKTSFLKGQHGRGRAYIPCVPNTFVTPVTDPNVINGVGKPLYDTLANALAVSIVATTPNMQPCITTRPSAPNTVPLRASIIFKFITELVLGTQRRRKEGRGQ
jgi:hypothetical protein